MSALGAPAVVGAGLAGIGLVVALVWAVGQRNGAQRQADALNTRLMAIEAAADPFELQPVMNALPVAVVVADASGAVRVSNPAGDLLLEPRIDSALVGRTVRAALAEATGGVRVRRIEELTGPPIERYIITAVPLADGGGGAVAVVQDDSDVARTEAVRRDFVANISHELKTPIGAVALLAEMLADEPDPTTAQRFATRIEAEVSRLGRSVDDLLELTQIEFGLPAGSAAVSLDEVTDEVIARIASVAGDRGISVDGPTAPSGLVVRGDRRQLSSALYNLVDNAVKYSSTGGTVQIAWRYQAPGMASVEVVDSGIGIPGADLERVFERFYRVDRARGRDTGGTGLGLAIVRHVTHNHGGTVQVSSTEGVGTTFTMQLPGHTEVKP